MNKQKYLDVLGDFGNLYKKIDALIPNPSPSAPNEKPNILTHLTESGMWFRMYMDMISENAVDPQIGMKIVEKSMIGDSDNAS